MTWPPLTRRGFLAEGMAVPLLASLRPLGIDARQPVTVPAPSAMRPDMIPRGPAVLFDEPEFPVVGGVDGPLRSPAPDAIVARSAVALLEALRPGAVLVWRHGAAFPAEIWDGVRRFLEAGGSWLQAGGAPFTRPAIGGAGRRRVEPLTLACTHELRLNQVYDATLDAPDLRWIGSDHASRALPPATRIAIIEPRLTDTRDFAFESGSPGARDALPRPLAHVWAAGVDPRFPTATAAWALDRLRGRFAGGRWVFWTLSAPPTDGEWQTLLARAAEAPVDLRVDPTFGCFHAGEQPSVLVRLHRPSSRGTITVRGTLKVTGPDSATASPRETTVAVDGGEHGSARVALPGVYQPGLYRARLDLDGGEAASTGFWVFDAKRFASGQPVGRDAYCLTRGGRPEPLVGTTVMSGTVHRDFLFEPNAAVWDDTFRDLAGLGMNVVRTGFWSGWRKVSADSHVVDESVLRALEAYYLTAREHGLIVVFNLFAFVPEGFGAADPYFDPRAREGQRALLDTLARRFAPARELVWDLINEPSFAAPDKLWSVRPSGSRFERDEFMRWLERRFGPPRADGASWQEVVRRRWRLAPDAPLDVPADDDFTDAYVFTSRVPYRAADYIAFSQDAFTAWAREMADTLRAAGAAPLVTIGQDEGGLVTRPSPLVHHEAVDFTSMHTWWNNDALLWDGVLAKASGRPLIVTETGLMLRELASRESVRGPDESAALLGRKLAAAFAAGASGVIQWCYDVNPFMDSDNEVAIGLRRVDGSVKPELGVLADLARFVSRNKARFAGYVEPDVALIVPSSEQYSPRDLTTAATRRVVRTCVEQLGVAVRAVAEARVTHDLGTPRAIVLPSCRGLRDEAWTAILERVEAGAVLACSGWFETDDAGLPAERLGLRRVPLTPVEAVREMDGEGGVYRFPGTVPESWFRADVAEARRVARGAGAILHHPLPIDWADPVEASPAFYAAALRDARVDSPVALDGGRQPGRVLATLRFDRDWLLVAINETAARWDASVGRAGDPRRVVMQVPAGRARYVFVDPDTWRRVDEG